MLDHRPRVYVAGSTGLVGSAIVRQLLAGQRPPLLILSTRDKCDLTDAQAARRLFATEAPEYVYVAAAKVGGILANDSCPADFIRENLSIHVNLLDAAYRAGVKKLLFLGSSCIYPRAAPQPMAEKHLLTGPLEPTNDAYAIAKIAGLVMCRSYNRQYGTNFIAAMPTNLYGPGDNFDPQTSHVLPALMRKFHRAKMAGASSVELWGTGSPRRELLYVDDLASALVLLMERFEARRDAPLTESFVNVGTGEDLTIAEIAEAVRRVVGFEGEVRWDSSKPDGMPRKLLDVSRIRALGWRPRYTLQQGLQKTYAWYLERGAP